MIFSALRERNQAAAVLGTSSVARQAFAQGLVLLSAALGVDAAHSSEAAWILAVPVDAGLLEGAILVGAAALNASVADADFSEATLVVPSARAIGNFLAGHHGVAGEAVFAGAELPVVDRGAVGVPTTDGAALARVLALAVDAGQVGRAIVVRPAAHSAMGQFANAAVVAFIVPRALRWR